MLPGGPGQPSARTKTGCLQWLDAGAATGGGSRPGPAGSPAAFRPTEARRRGQKSRDGAPSGERARARACAAASQASGANCVRLVARRILMVRRSALRPLPTPVGLARKRGRESSLPPKTTGGRRTTGLPGALTKN